MIQPTDDAICSTVLGFLSGFLFALLMVSGFLGNRWGSLAIVLTVSIFLFLIGLFI